MRRQRRTVGPMTAVHDKALGRAHLGCNAGSARKYAAQAARGGPPSARPAPHAALAGTHRAVLGVQHAQLCEDAHVRALQANAAFQQRDQLLVVPPRLVEVGHLRGRGGVWGAKKMGEVGIKQGRNSALSKEAASQK